MTKADIEITNSGSGFFGIHGLSKKGRNWVDGNVDGADRGEAWTDDRRLAMEIADGAIGDGMRVV